MSYSVLFADYARTAGVTSDNDINALWSTFRHANSVINTAPICVAESSRIAYDAEPVEPMPITAPGTSKYRQLQHQCKHYGLKANGSTAILQARLNAHLDGYATIDMYTKVKPAKKERAAKVAKKTVHYGLSYRQSQRAVSWFKANMPKELLPAMLSKNIGWGNVAANLDMLLTSHGWAAKLDDRALQQLVDYIGIIDQTVADTFLAEAGLA